MKRALFPVLRVVFLLGCAVTVPAQTFIWTGLGNGWSNQNAPTGAGGESIILGDAIATQIDLTPYGSSATLSHISIHDGDVYYIDSASPIQLAITSGLTGNTTDNNALRLGSNVEVLLSGNPVFNSGTHPISISGTVTGTVGTLSLVGTGAFTFNGAGNSYSGNTVIGSAAGTPNLFAWNATPFGTSSVSFYQGGSLTLNGAHTLANNLTLNTNAAGTVTFGAQTDPLTLSGSITLANNTTLVAPTYSSGVNFANKLGRLNVPGPMERNPVIFTGNIGQSGGARSITTSNSPGILIFAPTSGSNTYTGGTTVNSTLVFGNLSAIPVTGTVQNGTANTNNAGGYVGLADVTPGNFATFLTRMALTSSGSVGVDTMPGQGIVTLADNIDLSAFTTTATNGMRLGTATQAILTGAITPDNLANYHFGNGGGTLYVQSALNNVFTSTGLVMNNGNAVPLKLFLQGGTSYSGATVANSGFIIFDNTTLPASSTFQVVGSATAVGGSYIGITDSVSSTPSAYLAKFDKANSWGIVGFDTHGSNPTATYSNIDLTGFNNGVFLGTATSAILSGTLTPSTLTNGNNAANTLRFTAANGGLLEVNSILADINISTPLSVVLGSPTANEAYSSGKVVLTAANTYTGITTISNGLTLGIGNNNALGSSVLHLVSGYTGSSGSVGLEAIGAARTLSNNIVFDVDRSLHVMGSNALTLSGNLSGEGIIQLQRNVGDPGGALTLSGNNSAFIGDIQLQNFHLTMTSNTATGTANLRFFDNASIATFSGGATTPVLHGIFSDGALGRLELPVGGVLTFDTSNDNNHHEFGGSITGIGGGPVVGALVVTGSNTLNLYGNNQHTGGTTITNDAVLFLGHNNAAGTGSVTLDAPGGGIILAPHVTLTNSFTFTSGGIGGFGTLNPSNVTTLTVGANQFLLPGTGGGLGFSTGDLTLDFNVTFANNGSYYWSLQNPATLEGKSRLLINGNLDLTALSAGGFTLGLMTLDATGDEGLAPLVVGQNYQFAIVTTQGGNVLGFDANKFSIDDEGFQDGMFSNLHLTADATNIYLNFQAIPEPSTWALLTAGAAALAFAHRRRRAK